MEIEDLKKEKRKLLLKYFEAKEQLKNDSNFENMKKFSLSFLELDKVRDRISFLELQQFREDNEKV